MSIFLQQFNHYRYLILLVLLICSINIASYIMEVNRFKAILYANKITAVDNSIKLLNNSLPYLLSRNEFGSIDKLVAQLGRFENVENVYFVDDRQIIIAASGGFAKGQTLTQALGKDHNPYPQWQDNKTIWIPQVDSRLIALAPMSVNPSGLEDQLKHNFIFIQLDLAAVTTKAYAQANQAILPLLLFSAVVVLAILSYWFKSLILPFRAVYGEILALTGERLTQVKIHSIEQGFVAIRQGIECLHEQLDQHVYLVAEQHLRERNTQKISHTGSWEFDLNSKKLIWSEEVFAIYGLDFDSADTSLDKLFTAIHPDDLEKVQQAYFPNEALIEGCFELEHKILIQGTTEVRYLKERFVQVVNEQGEYKHTIGTVTDITESYLANLALLDKQDELNAILDIVADGIVSINADGTIRAFNSKAENLFGYESEQIIGQNVSALMPQSDAKNHDQYLLRYLHSGEKKIIGTGREVLGLNANGKTFPMRLSIIELPSDHSQPRRFIGTCVDLTETKYKDEMLRRSQKMDVMGKLTGGIAHDFNNILGVILGYAQLLKDQLSENEKLSRYAEQVYLAGERGAKLTSKLLVFSSRKPCQPVSVDINQLIDAEYEVMSKSLTARIKLNLQLQPQLWRVELDEAGFEDVLLNLSINAMHAIDGRGAVTITTKNIHLSKLKAQELELQPSEYVILEFADTGCGISEEVIEQIFDPFYSTKGKEGTGLGLSQVYGFCRSANGAIEAFSQLGVGTRFVLYFPKQSNPDELQ